MSAVMVVSVFGISILLKGHSLVLSLIAQIIVGMFVYCTLIICSQKTFLLEIKDLMLQQKSEGAR